LIEIKPDRFGLGGGTPGNTAQTHRSEAPLGNCLYLKLWLILDGEDRCCPAVFASLGSWAFYLRHWLLEGQR
jgi:hypothetical protein